MKSATILVKKLHDWFVNSVSNLQSPFLLVVRLYWGCQISQNGWAKLHSIPRVTDFFASLGLPAPGSTAIDFLDLVIQEAKNVRVGDPFGEGIHMGPMNNICVLEKTERHLADAQHNGARIVFGGKRIANQPTSYFFEPTVIDKVSPEMLLNNEETFGPVVPVITVDGYEKVIELANATGYGLQMAIFTQDIDKAFYFADRLRSGNVVINDTTDYWEAHEPFGGGGGTKSGYGRLGGRFTFDDMTHLKTVALHINSLTPKH